MQGGLSPIGDEQMREYERLMAEQAADSTMAYTFDKAFHSQPQSQQSERPKSKPKSGKKKSRGEGGGVVTQLRSDTEAERGESAGSRRSQSAMSNKSNQKKRLPGMKKELTIEERLDIQLQQIMKSKSKLAIAMERVSADMHIKKRDREISKFKRDMAAGLATSHAQREEIIRLENEMKEKDSKMEELKKRNFKLLTKQRTFDEMKSKMRTVENPETQADMELRVKKEIMSKVERTILELKHQKSELQKEVKAEQATNHKANLVISELEKEFKEVTESNAAAEDQVRYVMAEDAKNVARLQEVESQLSQMSDERAQLEASIKEMVEAKLTAEATVESHAEKIKTLEEENSVAQENMKELALQIADLDNTKNNSDRILFEQSKKHAMAAEKVNSLQKEVKALETALNQKNQDAEEEASMARDAVVAKLQTEVNKAKQGKEEIEVALGRLVATQEQKQLEWDAEKKEMEESMEKALRKVEKLPQLQAQLSAAIQEKERLAIAHADVTGKHRILEEGKSAADIAVHKRAELEATITELSTKLATLTKANTEAMRVEGMLKQQVGDLQSEVSELAKAVKSAAAEKAEMSDSMAAKDTVVSKARADLEEQLTTQELLRSEMTGMKFQCEDLQNKLKAERELAVQARSAAERDQEIAKSAQAEAKRLAEEKVEMAEELDALKIQMRALMTNRRASTFEDEELEKCRAIFDHIRKEELKEAEELLATGMPVDLTDEANFTPLMVACQFGQRKLVKALLRRGAAINLQNQNGDTALHCCMPEHEDLAKYLISKGANEGLLNNNNKKYSDPT